MADRSSEPQQDAAAAGGGDDDDDQHAWTPPASPRADAVARTSSGSHSADAAPARSEEERLQQVRLDAIQRAKTMGEEKRQAEEAERIANEAAKDAERAMAKLRAAGSIPIPPKPARDPPKPTVDSSSRKRKPKQRSSEEPMADPLLTEKIKEALVEGTMEVDAALGKFYTWMGAYVPGKGPPQ